MDQPKIRLYAMAAAYNDGNGQGTVVAGTWLAWNEQCACGEFVARYYLDGGKCPLTGVAAMEIAPEQLRRLLDVLDKNEPAARGEVLRLVPREERPEEIAVSHDNNRAVLSDNLRPAGAKLRCRQPGNSATGQPLCSGIPSTFCLYCEAVVEAADPA